MNLNTISRDLEAARSDAALFARLKGAAQRVTVLEGEYAAALAEHDRQAAQQAAAEREASYDGVTDIRIEEKPDVKAPDSLLQTGFIIRYTKPAYNPATCRSGPAEHVTHGFGALPPGPFNFLLEKCPERIPARILALAPDKPRAAFGAYFTALRRGHL